MTDLELLGRVLSCMDPSAESMHLVRRKGSILLALPSGKEAAARALALYQPQRRMARAMAMSLRGLAGWGLHNCVLPETPIHGGRSEPPLGFPKAEPGSCGVLLGSPEHRIRRAITSYRLGGRWEVAKISFGGEGGKLLAAEAQALRDMQAVEGGAPELLGFHQSRDVTLLRMPYLEGDPVPAGRFAEALGLLVHWVGKSPARPISAFPEWPFIDAALKAVPGGDQVAQALSRETLRPVICHGDFARWNLRSCNGAFPMALDWEWGHADGMPGIDLVHYFLQDHRLVQRKRPEDALRSTLADLNLTECADYLRKTGWQEHGILAVIACLAWKAGAGHQENKEFLDAAVGIFRSGETPI